ncbi:putative pre-16S rRNA nuclease [Abditibacteriota bacterium]|nr:putative pre-16S rRNA nuclease [Abditibacteriota bacterium]
MKFLALDFGQKRIGMALCDADERFAFAHKTLERKPNDNRGDMAAILSAIRLNEVEGVVCGVPGGSAKSDQTAQVAGRFFEKLRAEAETQGLQLEWHNWDERFSTSAFLTQLKESGASLRRARENHEIDAGAAAMMLEGFLASRRGHEALDAGDTV